MVRCFGCASRDLEFPFPLRVWGSSGSKKLKAMLVVERRRDKDALVGLISLLDLVALLASDECDG